MAASPPFEVLPPEIFETINVLLSLRDLCNIRLVSSSMASKATQDKFASFVRSRVVELTRPALETMAALTAEGSIGCFVEELTLAGVVYNTAGLQHQLQVGTRTMLGRGCEASGTLNEPTEPRPNSHGRQQHSTQCNQSRPTMNGSTNLEATLHCWQEFSGISLPTPSAMDWHASL
jgi:hypothetical protein